MKKGLRVILIFLGLYILIGLLGVLFSITTNFTNFLADPLESFAWIIYWPLLLFWIIGGQYGEHWIIAYGVLLIILILLFWLPFVIDKRWFGKTENREDKLNN